MRSGVRPPVRRDILWPPLRTRARAARAPLESELSLAVALGGVAVLAGTAHAGYRGLVRDPNGGSGCSSGGGGGGDGGGGCGGCGGGGD